MSQPLNRQKETTKTVAPTAPTPTVAPKKSLISAPKPAPIVDPMATAATKAVVAARMPEVKEVPQAEPVEEAKPVSFAQARQERLKRQQSMLGQTGRRGRRAGARGRRSLITGMGGGIGYYNRFAR
jgi:hypothetical protein